MQRLRLEGALRRRLGAADSFKKNASRVACVSFLSIAAEL